MVQSASEILVALHRCENIGQARAMLGDALNLDGPAAHSVTVRVLSDVKFADYLMAVRKFPEWRDRLLNDPMNDAFGSGQESDKAVASQHEGDAAAIQSTVDLVKRSGTSLLKWAATGFKTAEPWIVEKRKRACFSCDQLTEAPETLSYKIATAFAGSDNRMCRACGCLVMKKILMPDETCPLPSVSDENRTRWDQRRTVT